MTTQIPPYIGGSDPRWKFVPEEPYPMLIDGALVEGATSMAIDSPRDRSTVALAWLPDDAQIDQTVAAARRSLDGAWARHSGRDRGRLLRRLAELIETHADELAFLDAIDVGKPVTTSLTNDLVVSLEALDYFAGQAQAVTGRSIDTGAPGVTHRSRLEPVGVVLEVLPWNGPMWTGVQHFAAIMAAGCTAIMKPAELASMSWLRLAQLIMEAGFPPGVVNVVPGPGRTVGEAFVDHPGVDLVSLTGGIATGSRVLGRAASTIKKASVELGGKNPNIVCADADLEQAIMWSSIGGFSNTGQVCVCGSRILVHRSIHNAFVDGLAASAESLVVGDPLDPVTQLGPLIGEQQFDKVWRYVKAGVAETSLRTGGERYQDELRTQGWYAPPTVFTDVPASCSLFTDEIFGPVVTVTAFDTVDEAIGLANNTPYGLAAGVFTRDTGTATHVADRLQAGQIYVNQWFSPGGMRAPSQGYKQSGLGGVGMRKYQQEKNIFTRADRW